jgi:hypothetical protein
VALGCSWRNARLLTHARLAALTLLLPLLTTAWL